MVAFIKKHRYDSTPAMVAAVIGLCLLFLFAGGNNETAASSSLQREIQELQDHLSELEQDMQHHEETLDELESQETSVTQELNQLQVQLNRAESEMQEAETQLSLAEKQLQQAEHNLQEAQDELEKRQDFLGRRVRAMYELGMVSYLEVLLTATDFTDFVRRFHTLRQIISQDAEILEAVEQQKKAVEEHKRECERKKVEAEEWRSEVVTRRQALQADVARYENRLDELTSQQQEYLDALDEMERRSEQITDKISEIQHQMSLPGGTPSFQWPLDRGTYWISSPFGPRYHPILGQWRHHSGIDMAASSGTIIRAAADGEVWTAGWLGGYGKTVMIGHTDKHVSLYAHASTLLVKAGQQVKAGDRIARVGTTGFSTGPHLHFEIRVEGEPKDPQNFIPPH